MTIPTNSADTGSSLGFYPPELAATVIRQARALELSSAPEGERMLEKIATVAMELANGSSTYKEADLVRFVEEFKTVFAWKDILTRIGIDPDSGTLVKPELWRRKGAEALPVLPELQKIRGNFQRLIQLSMRGPASAEA